MQFLAAFMMTKSNAVLADIAQLSETEDLKPAGIRQDRARPVHEFMQTAGFLDEQMPGLRPQMIGVAEDNPSPGVLQLFSRQGFDRRLGADGHKHWRRERTVRGFNFPEAGHAFIAFFNQTIFDNHNSPFKR